MAQILRPIDLIPAVVMVLTVLLVCVPATSFAAEQQLTIKGRSDDVGTTLTFDDASSLSIESTSTGLILTLPNIDVRIRCLGTVTDQDYCYLGASGGSRVDIDNDGVIDDWDRCIPSSIGAYTNNQGCEDKDGDGVPDNIDKCPNENANTDTGCLATYVVTPSAGANGSVSPSMPQTVKEGTRVQFSLVPEAGYQVAAVTGSCGGALAADNSRYTTLGVTKDCDVSVTFELLIDDVTADYCKNAASLVSNRISCERDVNLDVWWQHEASYKSITIPPRRILSLPFSTRDSEEDKGQVQITANMPTLDSSLWSWHGWISEVPGGSAISQYCESFADKAQAEIAWTQIPNQAAWQVCYLGNEAGAYHFNFEVRCVPELGMACGTGNALYWNDTYYMEIFARP